MLVANYSSIVLLRYFADISIPIFPTTNTHFSQKTCRRFKKQLAPFKLLSLEITLKSSYFIF